MQKKIRVAFIYKPNYSFLTGKHFDNTTYDFFMKALKRSNEINLEYIPRQEKINVDSFNEKFDIILIPNNFSDATPELIGVNKLKIPVISRVGDPHDEKRYGKIKFHNKFKIDYYFNFTPKEYFYKFYPKEFSYKTIIFGLEPSKFQFQNSFLHRIDDKIILTGALGKINLKSRIINRILNPSRTGWYHYRLRTICNELPYVIHNKDLKNSEFPRILSFYKAAIAATTHFPTIKYLETPAAGCLTFMEINDHNYGKYLGYEDGVNAIFINEKNYEKKLLEFLDDPKNFKWEKIANNGREYVMNKLNNNIAVSELIKIMKELVKRN